MYRGEPVLLFNLYGQFAEIAELTADTLRTRGYDVAFTKIVDPADQRLYLLFGVNVWQGPLPRRYIIYQLEQSPIRKWFTPAYFARMAGAVQVWDYNLQNVEYLQARGIAAVHVPLGYSRIFDPPSQVKEDIDILFLGQLTNPHRQQVLAQLKQAGLVVVARNDVFGEAKKRLVARAKIVLNLHYGQEALLEEARIIPLLAAGKVVISETVKDPRYLALYAPVVTFVSSTAELIAQCRRWLSQDRRAHAMRVRAWTQVRSALTLFPATQIEEELPREVTYYPQEIPLGILRVLVDRSRHLALLSEWRPVRHYGHFTLLERR